MSRPEHLSVPNTPSGISRINQRQEAYDEDPAVYEAEQQEAEAAAGGEEDA